MPETMIGDKRQISIFRVDKYFAKTKTKAILANSTG